MDFPNKTVSDNEKREIKHEDLFIEDSDSSEVDGEAIKLNHEKKDSKRDARFIRENSPPLLLAFSITPGRGLREDRSPIPSSEEEEDSDYSVEEWMILGEEEQDGDSCIQLNLRYSTSEEEEEEEGDWGDEDPQIKSLKDTWAVSAKDKGFVDTSLSCRYYTPGHSLMFDVCRRMGHLPQRCLSHRKCPTCILCGIQGHIQRVCPSRPCHRCGLLSHGLKPCEKPPVWNQHCRRCGMTGHLSDTCPDTWRQYHMTIRFEGPLRPQMVQNSKHKKRPAHCYNCSKRGHYGYECTERRMVSGTFPSLPYVYCYDTAEEILQLNTRIQNRGTEVKSVGSLPFPEQQHQSEPLGERAEENWLVQGRGKTKHDTQSRAARRKTWPERRRERQEVKRLRREAQARREGGVLGRVQRNSDDESSYADPFSSNSQTQSICPPKKKRKEGMAGRSRKSREAERWKKRGGVKRGDLYPHGSLDIGSENLLSPKQRVRNRKR